MAGWVYAYRPQSLKRRDCLLANAFCCPFSMDDLLLFPYPTQMKHWPSGSLDLTRSDTVGRL